jgi:mycothiol synthase
MSITVRPYAPGDEAALLALLRAPGVREEFERFDSPQGVALLLGDPYVPEAGVRLATVDGEPAGFGFAILVPGSPAWAAPRGAVLPRFRRRGIGRALHASLHDYVRSQVIVPGVRELSAGAWQPSPGTDALMAALGYVPERWFWMMARPRGESAPAPAWPEGFEGRVFDGSEEALAEWNDAYNESFAAHFRFVPSDLERLRKQVRKPGFRADGVLLARLHGRPAGFCRCEIHCERGEIGVLGTTRDARGLGLGRALLRWGVGWLERECTGAVTLVVDGENEGALRLYRSEGFEVKRTRRMWARALDAP